MSVVVTAYNQAPYIGATIASVLAQTYRDFEVIVVDDGSTDDTETELTRYRSDIRYIRQRNRGVAAARNVGVLQARGRLVAFLDGDDMWRPEKLQRQVAAIEARPGSGLVVSDGFEFGPNEVLRESLMNPWIAKSFGGGEELLSLRCYPELVRQNLITTTSQVMVPRGVLDEVGVSDERYPVSSDWDLYLRIALAYDVTFMRTRLVGYRYLPSSASGPRPLRSFRWGLDEIRILQKHVGLAPPDFRGMVREELARRTRAIAEEAYYSDALGRAWARRYLWKVFVGHPRSLAAAAYLVGACTPRVITRHFGRVLRRMIGLRETS